MSLLFGIGRTPSVFVGLLAIAYILFTGAVMQDRSIGAAYAQSGVSAVIQAPRSNQRRPTIGHRRVVTNASFKLTKLAQALESKAPSGLYREWSIDELTDYLNRRGIATVIDQAGLEDEGLTAAHRIAIRGSALSVGSAISHALKTHRLMWTVSRTGDAMVIGSEELLDRELITLVYGVGNLVPDGDYLTLVNLITENVEPVSWDKVGGAGSVEAFPAGQQLVVMQSYQVHRRLKTLLEGMSSVGQSRSVAFPTNGQVPVGRGLATSIELPRRSKKRGMQLPNTDGSTGSYGGMGGGLMGGMGGGIF